MTTEADFLYTLTLAALEKDAAESCDGEPCEEENDKPSDNKKPPFLSDKEKEKGKEDKKEEMSEE